MILEKKKKGICSLCDESALDPHLLRSAVAPCHQEQLQGHWKWILSLGALFDLEAVLLYCFIITAVMVTNSQAVCCTMGWQQSFSKHISRSICKSSYGRPSTAAPQWMKWKDLSCPDSHYLITVSSAFSFSFKMFGSVLELKVTFTPGWQGQVFCGYSQALPFCVLYMLHSVKVCMHCVSAAHTAPGSCEDKKNGAWGISLSAFWALAALLSLKRMP